MALTKYIAMDCEMVQLVGSAEALARVSLVNEHGDVVYDKFVKPTKPVTDYRTHVSGVRQANLEKGQQFDTVQREVSDILKGRVLVGHSMANDLGVLKFNHPANDIRDTGSYFAPDNNNQKPSLQWLAHNYLGINIQRGEHSSVEDAQAAMKIYKAKAAQWEKDIAE